MTTKLNASPKPILKGIDDRSGGDLPVITEEYPIHLPHVYLFTEKGPLEPQLCTPAQIPQIFGSKTLDLRSKYTTHQTVLAQVLAGAANSMVVQRVKPSDAKDPAKLALSFELVVDEVSEYERDADGSVNLDQNGDPVTTGTTVVGYRGRWLVESVTTENFGARTVQAGTMTGSDGTGETQSEVYPVMDLPVSTFGEHGNHKGMRLWAPTEAGQTAPNREVYEDQDAFLYQVQFIERPDATSQPSVIETMTGGQSVEVAFKPGTVDKRTESELGIEEILIDSYRNLDVSPKQLGPFSDLHFYNENLEMILGLIYPAEQSNHDSWPTDAAEGMHRINLVSGLDIEGNAYYTFRVDGSGNGGVDLTRYSNHYATGGSDGSLTFSEFDTQVGSLVSGYGESEFNLLDDAMWPQSQIYDTGFTLETKKKLVTPIGLRKDIAVTLSTQDVSQSQNDIQTETSMGVSLRTAARAYPESEIYGTETCRATLVEHSGYLINSPYKGLVPMTIELAAKRARFMGAGNGQMTRNRGYDESPYNQINMLKDVNNAWMSQTTYDTHWDLGLVWAQNFDRTRLFFPAVQTVYSDHTSVLNSDINMHILMTVQKVCQQVWRELTGNTKLTDQQFLQRSDDLIVEKVEGRFDDRTIIVPNTYFTDIDAALGYAWSTDVTVYLNNMRTVGSFTVVADRRANFNG